MLLFEYPFQLGTDGACFREPDLGSALYLHSNIPQNQILLIPAPIQSRDPKKETLFRSPTLIRKAPVVTPARLPWSIETRPTGETRLSHRAPGLGVFNFQSVGF